MPVKCKICKAVIPDFTNGELIYCICKAIAVDGTKYYQRLIGNKAYMEILKDGDKATKGGYVGL